MKQAEVPPMKTPPRPFIKASISMSTPLGSPGGWSSAAHAAGRCGARGLTDPAPAFERTTDCPSAARLGMIRVFYPFGAGGLPSMAPTEELAFGSTATRCRGLSRAGGRALESIIGGHDPDGGSLGWSRDRRPPEGCGLYRPDLRGGRRDVWAQGGRSHRRGSLSVVDRPAWRGVRA
jgi:hypothetical protein